MTPRCQTGKGVAQAGCGTLGMSAFPASRRKAASFTRCSVSVPTVMAIWASCASCSGVKCTSIFPDYEITGSGAMMTVALPRGHKRQVQNRLHFKLF